MPATAAEAASKGALPAFRSTSRKATRGDVSKSWRTGCPVSYTSLHVVQVRYLGWDNKGHMGTLIVHKSVSSKVRTAFKKLYAAKFPIRRMQRVDLYGGSDRKSMAADNTSAFNCRLVAGTRKWSNHAYGKAIDVNPVENPYVNGRTVSPPAGRAYLKRSTYKKGLIKKNSKAMKAFTSQGFTWGGRWPDPDYQHFDLR